MGKAYNIPFLLLLSLLSFSGCHEIDRIVVPINNATLDLNRTKDFDMPLKLFPGAKVRLKGTKLAIEKEF